MLSLYKKLCRKKYVTYDSSPLPRVLKLHDLVALGTGATVGVGFYVLAGDLSKNVAGPAVVISFLIAAIASLFSGLCYAEFSARVPKAGSAYIYSYVTVGEFVAFIIGWNLILEFVIGSASVALGFSVYVDELFYNTMSNALNSTMHINIPTFSDYPDFLAFGLTFLITVLLSIGIKESSVVNNVFSCLNVCVILYVIIAGATTADIHNWYLSEAEVQNTSICSNPKDETPKDPDKPWGVGGFAPYGFEGIIQAAATCFFGFIGFDVVATTAEEAIRPERNIPLAITTSLCLIFFAYFSMSTVVNLALPYCMQDKYAPLVTLFKLKDMNTSMWIVSIGALFGFLCSLLGAMVATPRIIYAMGDDGLIFRSLSAVNKRFKTPLYATILSGLVSGCMALLFDLKDLVNLVTIGTLMAYTVVSLCVLILRYLPHLDLATDCEYTPLTYYPSEELDEKSTDEHPILDHVITNDRFTYKEYAFQAVCKFSKDCSPLPSGLSSRVVNFASILYAFFCFFLALSLSMFKEELNNGEPASLALVCCLAVISFTFLLVIACQPTSNQQLDFKVPLVPWIPALSVFINFYLMCNMNRGTWIGYAGWLVIGLSIYFFYGIRNSSINLRSIGETPPSVNRVAVDFTNINSLFDAD